MKMYVHFEFKLNANHVGSKMWSRDLVWTMSVYTCTNNQAFGKFFILSSCFLSFFLLVWGGEVNVCIIWIVLMFWIFITSSLLTCRRIGEAGRGAGGSDDPPLLEGNSILLTPSEKFTSWRKKNVQRIISVSIVISISQWSDRELGIKMKLRWNYNNMCSARIYGFIDQ